MHHPHDAGRMTDLGAEQRGDVATLKQEKIRAQSRLPVAAHGAQHRSRPGASSGQGGKKGGKGGGKSGKNKQSPSGSSPDSADRSPRGCAP
jgi:hypothetical protein